MLDANTSRRAFTGLLAITRPMLGSDLDAHARLALARLFSRSFFSFLFLGSTTRMCTLILIRRQFVKS
jgi:hypothetical protein